ncbi:MAG: hypothetical protein WA974_11560 [Thermodesulfobacteriota bacterium]
MRYFKFLCAVLSSVFLFGCFQTDTVIHLKPDGSGFIEETFMLSNAVLDSFQNLSKELTVDDSNTKNEGKKESKDPLQGMIEEARSKARQYGPDVEFVSATPVKTETLGGYKALYAFKDINTLRINQNPKDKTGKLGDGQDNSAKKEELILFKLVKGPVSTLTVTMPEHKEDKKNQDQKTKEPIKSPTDPKAEEMMKELFKDMGVKVSLVIDGTIIKTNATYRNKSELTLIEMHFGKIFENKEVFDMVSAAEPKTIEEMKELVKDLKGLKIEMNNPVVVEFK